MFSPSPPAPISPRSAAPHKSRPRFQTILPEKLKNALVKQPARRFFFAQTKEQARSPGSGLKGVDARGAVASKCLVYTVAGGGGSRSGRRRLLALTSHLINYLGESPPSSASCRKSHHASALKLIRFHPRHLARPPARPPLGADASHETSNSAASVIRMTSHASAGSFRAVAPNVKERPQGFFFFSSSSFSRAPFFHSVSQTPAACVDRRRAGMQKQASDQRAGAFDQGGTEGRSSAFPTSLRTHPEAVLILNNALCLLLARKHA